MRTEERRAPEPVQVMKNEEQVGTEARWDTQMRSFRVRLMRFDRPQSKTVTVRANNEAGARAQARGRAGHDWRIAGITAI